jgi:predicted translin family RNA/ssDNA-binding protein
VNPEQAEGTLSWLERIHAVLTQIENRLEELQRQMDLQRETLDNVLVNAMEIADRVGGDGPT